MLDFNHCCRIAVNQSLEYFPANKSIRITTDWIEASFDELYINSSQGQFPCGAKYNGNRGGKYRFSGIPVSHSQLIYIFQEPQWFKCLPFGFSVIAEDGMSHSFTYQRVVFSFPRRKATILTLGSL